MYLQGCLLKTPSGQTLVSPEGVGSATFRRSRSNVRGFGFGVRAVFNVFLACSMFPDFSFLFPSACHGPLKEHRVATKSLVAPRYQPRAFHRAVHRAKVQSLAPVLSLLKQSDMKLKPRPSNYRCFRLWLQCI